MNRKKIKSRVIVFLFLAIVIVYIFTYYNDRSKFNRGKVVFYEMGDTVEYGGVEYKISGEFYTLDELAKEFGEEIKLCVDSISEQKYILLKKEYKRVSESNGKEKMWYHCNLNSAYWQAGIQLSMQEYIQTKEYIPVEELKVGESSWCYELRGVSKVNCAKSVWENIENSKAYYEMPDYEGSEYLRKVEVIN